MRLNVCLDSDLIGQLRLNYDVQISDFDPSLPMSTRCFDGLSISHPGSMTPGEASIDRCAVGDDKGIS